MTIPAFPEFREIEIEDKAIFDRALAANPPELSTYTFTNLFAWRKPYNMAVSELDGMLIVRDDIAGRRIFLEPLGAGDVKSVIEQVFEHAGSSEEVVFGRLHERVARLFENDARFQTQYDRDESDYLYLASDLIQLTGRKFDGKRNFIHRFKASTEYEYTPMTQASVEECHRFAEYWCEERLCQTIDGLNREQCAVYEMLMNFEALGIVGGTIKVNGDVIAFALGEALNPETFLVHVEKADSKIDGVYQMINNEFCTHEACNFKYVNREQDLGVMGLRKAKLSYNPIKLVDAYSLRRA